MKKTKLLTGLSLAFICIIVASSCKKDNNSGSAGLSATVNGAAWQAQITTAEHPNSDAYVYLIGASFKPNDSTGIEIDINDSVKVGQADNLVDTYLYYYKSTNTSDVVYSSDDPRSHGSITLSAFDKNAHKVAGTFSAVLYNPQSNTDSIKVENGHFNVTYTVD